MFKFTRNFTIASVIGLVIVVGISGYLYRIQGISNLTELGERQNADLVQIFVNNNWENYSPFVSDLQNKKPNELRRHGGSRDFDRVFRAQTYKLNIHLISVLALNGNTIYSTNPRKLGFNQSNNKMFIKAKAGRISSELAHRDIITSMEEVKLNRYVVVSFVPIYKAGTSQVEAVFELHLDVTDSAQGIDSRVSLVYLIAGLLLLCFLVILFMLVNQADRSIKTLSMNLAQQDKFIEHQGYHDMLTGLPNRILFRDRLEKEIDKCQQNENLLALLFIDLDHFQKVNDALGYSVGDGLLLEISNRLKQCVRSGDTVARIGGDEFVIILQSISVLDEVEEVVRQILETVADEYVVDRHTLFMSPSIGIAAYPFTDDNVNTLLKKANSAMNKAKLAGRNTFRYFTESTRQQIASRFSTENYLRRALERDEFELYYQPVVQIKTGKIVSVEALIRWHSPDQGFTSPDNFIPLLEETGLIIPVGQWVLESACRQGVAWSQQGVKDLKININMSARQLLHKDLIKQVNDALDKTGLQPHLLDLEITESLLIEDFSNTIHILDNLNEIGVSLSIDDFGTGYSSLSYLKRMPVDTLKIDQSFVRDITVNMDDAAIVEAICALSKSLRFKITAEGVEHTEQMEYLRRYGVTAVQGYLFSKPLPAADLEHLLIGDRLIAPPCTAA